MKQVVLFEDAWLKKFYPIAMTRHIAQIRWGILTIQQKLYPSLHHLFELLIQRHYP